MKIRIRDNSVRFRLAKSEVAKLTMNKIIQSTTDLLTEKFEYAIHAESKAEKMSIAFNGNAIILTIPHFFLADWQKSDKVGFYGEQQNQNGSLTRLILEKDFVCLDNTNEDQSDNYQNPRRLLY